MSLLKIMGIGEVFAENAPNTNTGNTGTTTTTTSTPTSNPPAPSQTGSFLHMLPMLVLFILVFYFLLVRPQTKRAKEQKKLMGSLAVGDEVMTAGGIIGRITRLKDNYIGVDIAKGVEITIQRSSIVNILPKGTMDSAE
jgi:preprotein translocase subunit YajC